MSLMVSLLDVSIKVLMTLRLIVVAFESDLVKRWEGVCGMIRMICVK